MRCASPPASVPAGAVEGEVVQADVDEERQPLVDLLEHPLGDLRLAVGEVEARAGTPQHSPIGIAAISAMDFPPTVTARETGLSRAPSHAGHGTSRMKPSKRSRLVSLSDSAWRRWTNGITPSNAV